MLKVVTDPKTGRMSTVEVGTVGQPALEKLRREVQDMVAGNVQFHTDPNAAPAEPPLPDLPGLCLDSGEFIPARELSRA